IENTGAETSSEVNEVVVRQYMKQLGQIVSGNEMGLLEIAMRMPDTMKTEREDIDEEEYKVIKESLEEALKEINIFRTEEGKVLEADFQTRIGILKDLFEKVAQMDPDRLLTIRERLEKAVADLKADLDTNRFEQELIYYL